MRLRTNVASLVAQRKVADHSRRVEDSQRKISSGKRITRAGDDAAGLSISSKLDSTLQSKRQAIRNTNAAVSFIQVAEGGISEIANVVVRMRELAMQAATATVSDSQRLMIDLEAQQLKQEINRLSKVTEFNGKKLLNGDEKKLQIQVDVRGGGNDRLELDMVDLAQNALALGIHDVNLSSRLSAQFALAKLDYAQKTIGESMAKLGSYQTRLTSTASNLGVNYEKLTKANSQIKDVDVASESVKQMSSQLKLKTAISATKITNERATKYLKLFD